MTASPLRRGLAALVLLSVGCAPPAEPPAPAPATPATPAAPAPGAVPDDVPRIEWGLVLHGGAGTITPDRMTPELEREYHGKLAEALREGHRVLAAGGSSLDAVVAAIVVLEDSPLFNAGKGAVFTAEGTTSLDASIMSGSTLGAGAVAGVTTVRNPIVLARRVMEASPHVLLAGEGAEAFAAEQRVEQVDRSYFHTDRRWRQLEEARDAEKHGTVGVVALDRTGALAAGTSTGGMTNKKWGRIGDSPIIGAGTYAGPRCGVSSTGWGEYFIRNVVAYDICARMEYRSIPLIQAAREVIMDRLEGQAEDTGGIVAMDDEGHVVMTFNTAGMYRGYVGENGDVVTEIYR